MQARLVEWMWYHDDILLAPMKGLLKDTLAANSIIFRPMGCQIGARTLLIDYPWTDMDCITFGNDCVCSYPHNQVHSYEDRTLKIGRVTVGDGCALVRCTLMANSKVGDGATVLANSTVAKGEELPAGGVYSGIPTTGNPAAMRMTKRYAKLHPAPDFSQDRSCMAATADHF